MLHTNQLTNPVAYDAYIEYLVPGLLYKFHVKSMQVKNFQAWLLTVLQISYGYQACKYLFK